eukprot:56226_1
MSGLQQEEHMKQFIKNMLDEISKYEQSINELNIQPAQTQILNATATELINEPRPSAPTIPTTITTVENKQDLLLDDDCNDLNIMIKFNENSIEWDCKTSDKRFKDLSLLSLHQFISNQFKINMYVLKYSHPQANELEIHTDHDLNEAVKSQTLENENGIEILVFEYIPKNIPLHKFTVNDICNTLKQWVYSDIDYQKHLSKIKKIFESQFAKLNQEKINCLSILSAHHVKCIIKEELLAFMTSDTLDIIFNCFEKWKNDDCDSITSISKPVEQIAHILYNYPFQRLIERINKEKIDGGKMIDILKGYGQKNGMIQTETGWANDEIEQIRLLLFKYRTMRKQQFIENMNKILISTNSIPYWMINKIRETMIDEFDVEMLHYNIKNNKDIHSFSDTVINLVGELIEENKKEHDDDDNLVK